MRSLAMDVNDIRVDSYRTVPVDLTVRMDDVSGISCPTSPSPTSPCRICDE